MITFLASFLVFGLAAGALALSVRRGARTGGRTCSAERDAECAGCEVSMAKRRKVS